jgi:hypothetical protein
MPKLRLNASMREALYKHAETLVSCPGEAAAEGAAFVALTACTDALVRERFPAGEMALLVKWHFAQTRESTTVRCAPSAPGKYDGRSEDVPLGSAWYVPVNAGSDQNKVNVPRDHDVWGLHASWQKAKKAHVAARQTKLHDYRVLIDTVRNFEDVQAVWPEAVQIRNACVFGGLPSTNLPATLTSDVVERIRADVAARHTPRA